MALFVVRQACHGPRGSFSGQRSLIEGLDSIHRQESMSERSDSLQDALAQAAVLAQLLADAFCKELDLTNRFSLYISYSRLDRGSVLSLHDTRRRPSYATQSGASIRSRWSSPLRTTRAR